MAQRRREALTQVGGAVELEIEDAALGGVLSRALEVTNEREEVLRHVHGFHSYPARMHPDTAAELVQQLCGAQSTVLDPFCGSGTVLVEARLAGHRVLGVDANPVAVELSWLKTGGLSGEEAAELEPLAMRVAEHAQARREAKAGPSRKYGRKDRELFDPHMLLELDGLRSGIDEARLPKQLDRAARLVLSSLLTKVSRQPGDTAERRGPRRLPGGFAIRLFVDRARLLGHQLTELWELMPEDVMTAKVRAGDARALTGVRPNSVHLVVTSPPYPGVYDYHSHHVTRLRWLGLEDRGFEQLELGARRRMARLNHRAAVQKWSHEFVDVLVALRRVVRRDGLAAVLIADSVLGDQAVYADELVAALAPRAKLAVVGRASQARPHFHAPTRRAFHSRPRREHLILLG